MRDYNIKKVSIASKKRSRISNCTSRRICRGPSNCYKRRTNCCGGRPRCVKKRGRRRSRPIASSACSTPRCPSARPTRCQVCACAASLFFLVSHVHAGVSWRRHFLIHGCCCMFVLGWTCAPIADVQIPSPSWWRGSSKRSSTCTRTPTARTTWPTHPTVAPAV